LDWKKAVMLKIEEGLHEKGCKLIDLYKFMDLEEDQKISIIEFKDLFYKVGIEWDIVKITALFKDIDNDDSKYIDYQELLHYIKEAKRENERLERQRQIRDRSERLNQ
jgi:Ca2+-binding EF-hand superfamily protein